MIKIGITGSIASGKTTASKILSNKRGPLFSADGVVKKLYNKKFYQRKIARIFNIKNISNLKSKIRNKILKNKKNISKLERLIHPIVRKEMKKFSSKNKNKKIVFFEIPLLIESKLTKYFDIIIFIKANKKIREKRYKTYGFDKKIFNKLNNKQLPDIKKSKFCDHVVVNEKNLNILKKDLSDIIQLYV